MPDLAELANRGFEGLELEVEIWSWSRVDRLVRAAGRGCSRTDDVGCTIAGGGCSTCNVFRIGLPLTLPSLDRSRFGMSFGGGGAFEGTTAVTFAGDACAGLRGVAAL